MKLSKIIFLSLIIGFFKTHGTEGDPLLGDNNSNTKNWVDLTRENSGNLAIFLQKELEKDHADNSRIEKITSTLIGKSSEQDLKDFLINLCNLNLKNQTVFSLVINNMSSRTWNIEHTGYDIFSIAFMQEDDILLDETIKIFCAHINVIFERNNISILENNKFKKERVLKFLQKLNNPVFESQRTYRDAQIGRNYRTAYICDLVLGYLVQSGYEKDVLFETYSQVHKQIYDLYFESPSCCDNTELFPFKLFNKAAELEKKEILEHVLKNYSMGSYAYKYLIKFIKSSAENTKSILPYCNINDVEKLYHSIKEPSNSVWLSLCCLPICKPDPELNQDAPGFNELENYFVQQRGLTLPDNQ